MASTNLTPVRGLPQYTAADSPEMAEINAAFLNLDDAVPNSLTVNGKPLTDNITLNMADVGGGNRDLLDNAYFKNPVNQREQTSYTLTDYAYFIDRWKAARATVALQADGLKFAWNGSISGTLTQRVEGNGLFGKLCTLSFEIDGTVYSKTATFPTTTKYNDYTVATGIALRFQKESDNYATIALVITKVGDLIISRAKLELGDVSTLANDPPPDFGQELAKCQRYFINLIDDTSSTQAYLGQVVAPSATAAYGLLPLPVTMRAKPVFLAGTTPTLFKIFGTFTDGYNGGVALSTMSIYNKMANGIDIKVTAENLVPGNVYQIFTTTPATAKVMLSAEL